MITCKVIKTRIEALSGIKDIGIKSRKREIADLKSIYCKLAKEFAVVSLENIGSALRDKYDHASVSHNINKFDHLGAQLMYYDIYDILSKEFTIEEKVQQNIAELENMSEIQATLMSFADFLNGYEGFKDIRFDEMVREYIASKKKEKALKDALENKSCNYCRYHTTNMSNEHICFIDRRNIVTITDPENYSCSKWDELPF